MDTPRTKHPDLYAEIMAYCDARDVSKSRFGSEALNDPAFVTDLEGGRELRRNTVDAVRRYMVTGEPRKTVVAA